MLRESMRSPLCAVLCGLLLMACGGTEADPAVPEELLGTQQAELCAGLRNHIQAIETACLPPPPSPEKDEAGRKP